MRERQRGRGCDQLAQGGAQLVAVETAGFVRVQPLSDNDRYS